VRLVWGCLVLGGRDYERGRLRRSNCKWVEDRTEERGFWTLRQWRFTDGGVCVDFWELFFFAFFLRLSDEYSVLFFFHAYPFLW
jgi:hypothetical protein